MERVGSSPEVPERIEGRYRVETMLGHGGMGVVYRVHDELENRPLALKVLNLPGGVSERSLIAFQQEFAALRRLRHPNVPQVFDFGQVQNGQPFFTMSLVEGTDLSRLMPLTPALYYEVFIQLAQTLSFIHSRRVVHGDVKASNVRVQFDPGGKVERVILLDFGLVGAFSTRDIKLSGTPSHLPPEAFSGGERGMRTDLYSLGVMMFQGLTGQLPRQTRARSSAVARSSSTLVDLNPIGTYPAALVRLIRSLLAASPALRPASADAVVEVLASLSGSRGVELSDEQKRSYLATPALIGRSGAMRRLRDAESRARDGLLDVVLISGVAGEGKTRLLDEFILDAQVAGARVLRAVCSADVGTPFAPVLEAMAPLLLGRTQPDAVLFEVAPVLVRVSEQVQRLFPAVKPVERLDDKDAEVVRMVDAMERWLLSACGDKLVLLSIDDLQWVDTHTFDLLERLVSRRGGRFGLLVLGAFRSDELSALHRLSMLIEEHAELVLQLGSFDALAVRELLRKQFAIEEPPDALIEVLVAETGGNPYFLHEMLRYLVEDGQIRMRRGLWRLPSRIDDLRLPQRLSDVVIGRLQRCSPEARELAALLALAGRPLDALVLSRVWGGDAAVGDPLQDLIDQDIAGHTEQGYALRHASMLERLRQDLAPELAQRLHLRLAEAMAAMRPENPGNFGEGEIGRHYQLGGDPERALPLLISAGQRAFDLQAQHEALRVFEWALEILRTRPYVPGGELDQIEAQVLRLRFYLDPASAIAVADGVIARVRGATAFGRIPELRRWLGPLAVYYALIVTLLKLRAQYGTFSRDTLRSLYVNYASSNMFLAVAYGWIGRLAEADTLTVSAIQPLMPGVNSTLGAVCDVSVCVPLSMQGRAQELHERLERVRRILEGPKGESLSVFDRHIYIWGGAYCGLATADAYRGLPHCIDALRAHTARGEYTTLIIEATKMMAYASFYGLRGEMVQLEQELRRFRQIPVTVRPQTHEIIQRGLAWACIEAGFFDRARAIINSMKHIGAYSESQRTVLLARCPGAITERLALVAHGRALAASPELRSDLMWQLAGCVEAEVLLEGGEPRKAILVIEETLRSARDPRFRNEFHEMVAIRLHALAEHALGRRDAAVRLAHEAHALAVRYENPIRIGLGHMTLAEVLASSEPLASDEHLREAIRVFERLGNTHMVRRCIALRANVSGATGGPSESWGMSDPHQLTWEQAARLTWSMELSEVVEGVLFVLGQALPSSRRWVMLYETTDSPELLLGQDDHGEALSQLLGVPDEAFERVRRSERPDAPIYEFPESRLWIFPLTRPPPPGGGPTGPAFGLVLVRTAEASPITAAYLREMTPRIRILAGFLGNALEHARLAQREYRLSMVTQLAQLLASVRSREELIDLVLDRVIDVTGADRGAMILLDDRNGELRLERLRDIDRASLPTFEVQLPRDLLEKAIESGGVQRISTQPPMLGPSASDHCLATVVPLRSLLHELEGRPIEIRRRQEALVQMSGPELSTLAQSETGGTAVGVVYLETDERYDTPPAIDEPLVVLLAGQAGFAIDVARLDRQLVEEVRQQEQLKSQRAQLERYLSAEVANAILADPDLVSLGAKRAVVTLLFTDVRGFSSWSSNLPSSVVVETLNQIFSLVTPIIFRHGGTLDKYLGDGLMAIFGAPVEMPDHALHAVLAAREIQEAIGGWLQGLAARGERVPGTGIGIHTGEVSVGNIGAVERMEYTAVGDVVNMASRICGVAGPGQVVISEATLAALPIGIFSVRKQELVRLKGRDDPFQLYEVI